MMNLSEKITALRTERKLSQGDVAEKLEVSRQSVSKWETGQSVPELDKIVKLADLFGVSVDELVRDGEIPQPAWTEPPEPKTIRIGLNYTPAQTLGIILLIGGLALLLFSGLMRSEALMCAGGALALSGVPLLLAKKHPFLVLGWLVWTAGYLILAFFYYPITRTVLSPLYGFTVLPRLLSAPPQETGLDILAMDLLFLAYLLIAVLTVLLPVLTVRAGVIGRDCGDRQVRLQR